MLENSVYSLIGFNCEDLVKELDNYKDDKSINRLVVDGAYNIVNRFDRVGTEKGLFNLEQSDEGVYMRIFLDLMRERKITLTSIKDTKAILEKLAQNINISEDEISKSKDFFNELGMKCRKYIDDRR